MKRNTGCIFLSHEFNLNLVHMYHLLHCSKSLDFSLLHEMYVGIPFGGMAAKCSKYLLFSLCGCEQVYAFGTAEKQD